MSNTSQRLKQAIDDFLMSGEPTVWIERRWLAPNYVNYRSDVKRWIQTDGLAFFEFRASKLTADILASKIVGKGWRSVRYKSAFRQLCEYIDSSPAGVITVYRCAELSSTAVQLLSRLSRHLESSYSGWKLIMVAETARVSALTLKLLDPAVMVGVQSPQSDYGTHGQSTPSGRYLKPIRWALLTVSLMLLIALFDGAFEGTGKSLLPANSAPTSATQRSVSVATQQDELKIAGRPEDSKASVLDASVDKEMREWAAHAAEFDEIMKQYANVTSATQEPDTSISGEPSEAGVSLHAAREHQVSPAGAEQAMSKEMWRAANQGDINRFSELLDSGQSIDARSENKETALIIASILGHQELVTWLLAHQAKVNIVDADNRTALYYAAVNGHYEVASTLLKNNAKPAYAGKLSKTPLMAAVHNQYFELSELLLASGSPVNKQDHSGWSALFYAVWNGDAELVSLLLEAGANTSLQDKDGYTVYDIAKAKQNGVLLNLLAKN